MLDFRLCSCFLTPVPACFQDAEGPGPLTDDSKEASRQPLHQDHQPGTMTDDSKEATRLSHSQQVRGVFGTNEQQAAFDGCRQTNITHFSLCVFLCGVGGTCVCVCE